VTYAWRVSLPHADAARSSRRVKSKTQQLLRQRRNTAISIAYATGFVTAWSLSVAQTMRHVAVPRACCWVFSTRPTSSCAGGRRRVAGQDPLTISQGADCRRAGRCWNRRPLGLNRAM